MVEVIVEYDYTAKEPDELTIKRGDIIRDVVKKQGGWWEGVLYEKRGMFPDNYVKPLDKDSPVILRNKKDISRIRQCRVVFSYNQDHEDELNLNVGDIINIIGEEEEGWWRGNLNGKEGVFPSNFVEEITQQPSRPMPSNRNITSVASDNDSRVPKLPVKPTKQLCEVKYAYKSQNEDELSFKEGDIITLISKESQDPGWWKGELDGKIGVFPDNFVTLIHGDEKTEKSSKDDRKSSKPITETGVIKPNSIATQRKSLEVKSEGKTCETIAAVNKTPPLPGKKPLLPIKKSPTNSGSSIFCEIKKKIVDVVDGATPSKSLPLTTEVETREYISNNGFDQVQRRPLLMDVRATRAKAPGRRLPTTLHKEEDSILNGNIDHLVDQVEISTINLVPDADYTDKPRLREWERYRAPWLEEMKLNQAKRTSTSPGPESKLKLTSTVEKTQESEESNSSKSSLLEKENDMSKSMPPIDLTKSLLSDKLKTSPNEHDKVPMIMKPSISSSISNRQSLSIPSPKEVQASNRHSVNTIPVKEYSSVKPPAPAPPKIGLGIPLSNTNLVTVQKSSLEKVNDIKAYGNDQEFTIVQSSHNSYDKLLERIQKLEVIVEKQNQAIEDLINKLQVETDMRMLLQEKVLQNVQV